MRLSLAAWLFGSIGLTGLGGCVGLISDAGSGPDQGLDAASDADSDGGLPGEDLGPPGFDLADPADTEPPSVPAALVVSDLSATQLRLSWSASTDNLGVTRYEIALDGGTSGVAAFAVAAPSLWRVVYGLEPSTAHQLSVRACDRQDNCSAWSAALPATTPAHAVPTLINRQSSRISVPLSATVRRGPAAIRLAWPDVTGVTRSAITIWRRSQGAVTWGASVATPAANSNAWTDTNVTVGTAYEYKAQLTTSVGTSHGYLTAGIDVPAPAFRGKIVVVVDSTVAPQLAAGIDTLKTDLAADGWLPVVVSVARTDTAPTVRSAIKAVYDADPSQVRAVLLLGHVPVAYSGTVSPDGHSEHNGAWPADGYYGDMDTTWPTGGGTVWNGDLGGGAQRNGYPDASSKFSPSTFPSTIELEVGRVDLYNLPAFSGTELQLLSGYLARLSELKRCVYVPERRALVVDQLGGAGYNFTRAALSVLGPAVGPTRLTLVEDIYNGPDAGGQQLYQRINGQSYLYSHGTGYGGNDSAQTIGTTANLAATEPSSVFNFTFGSYFGDWDTKNNFLRAFLAKGKGLTNVYSGDLLFYGHSMALGGTIGDGMRGTMNNSDTNYSPSHGGCCGDASHNVYAGLMGDPTLRAEYVPGPTGLQVSQVGGNLAFTWSPAPSSASVDGYHVYEITAGEILRLTNALVLDAQWVSTLPWSSGRRFLVRAQTTTVSPAGSYHNLSLGAE